MIENADDKKYHQYGAKQGKLTDNKPQQIHAVQMPALPGNIILHDVSNGGIVMVHVPEQVGRE